MNAVLASPEQIGQIRKYGEILFDDPNILLVEFGTPDRFSASRLILAADALMKKGSTVTLADIRERAGHINTTDSEEKEETISDSTEDIALKECVKCHEPKPANAQHFGQDRRTEDGLGKTCLQCRGARGGKKARRAKPQPAIEAKAREPEPTTARPLPAGLTLDPPISKVITLRDELIDYLGDESFSSIEDALEVWQLVVQLAQDSDE